MHSPMLNFSLVSINDAPMFPALLYPLMGYFQKVGVVSENNGFLLACVIQLAPHRSSPIYQHPEPTTLQCPFGAILPLPLRAHFRQYKFSAPLYTASAVGLLAYSPFSLSTNSSLSLISSLISSGWS